MKKTLLIDMDEVLCDFKSSQRLKDWDRKNSPSAMYELGFFEELSPLPGAMKAVHEILGSGKYDIYICTQPLAKSVISYTEKAAWVGKYLPDLIDKIIMTQDKSLIKGDILIDDNKKWKEFGGEFVWFNPDKPSDIVWGKITKDLLSREDEVKLNEKK